jgi:hypothetical protein
MVHSVPSPDVAEQVVNDFWAGICTGNLDTIVQTTHEELRALCPSVDTFSFDIVDDPQAEAAEHESPLAAVETGTPCPVVTSWNEDKLVGLFQYAVQTFIARRQWGMMLPRLPVTSSGMLFTSL